MIRLALAMAGAGLAAIAADSAHAAIPANILPQAEFIEDIIGFPGDPDPPGRLYEAENRSYANTHVSPNHSATLEAHAVNRSQIAGSPLLTIDGRAVNTGVIEPGYETVRAIAEANYYFEVVSPLGDRTVPIILPIEWSVGLSREAEGSAFVQWEVSVTPQLDRFRGSASTNATYTVNEIFHTTTGGDRGITHLKLDAYTAAFDYYKVHIKVSGSASRLADPFYNPRPASGSASFSAVIDPLPYVDPAFANAASTSFFFSENLFASSVPEPSVFWLLAVGIGAIVSATPRRDELKRAG
ncbi:MAG: hypothetical protein IPK20_18000 [Betaproteobacteria bacterium]|nr:hypothetical protein [Betaproteobacteria bacterium]